jgi:hypothetical protein
MKRATWMVLGLMLCCCVMASAKDMAGRFGVGYISWPAPVGIRFWMNPQVGFDAGFGFVSRQEWSLETAGEKETLMDFAFDVGIPFCLVPTKETNFYLRPGFTFQSHQEQVYDMEDGVEKKSETDMVISAMLMVEHFLSDNLSIEGGHGFAVDIMKDVDEESWTAFGTGGTFVGEFGFHFYFE